MDFNLYNISKKGFIFSKYEITEDSNLVFTVRRNGIFSTSYIFFDPSGHEVMTLSRVFKLFKTNFNLFRDSQLLAKISSVSGAFKNNFIIETDDQTYNLGGNFRLKEFTISNGERDVAKISRKTRTNHNMYGFAVDSDEDQELIIGITFAMEAVRIIRRQQGS